ncbi:MAG: membrane dipeptidase, partial [Myxococcales bacterium]|nr:membrane dipeptidase [Myxococcales bacterium]
MRPAETAAQVAQRFQISEAAVQLAWDAELIDLHLDTFIPPRLWGYDVFKEHKGAPLGIPNFGHLDVPRMARAGLSGGMWSITTNPARTRAGRWRQYLANVQAMQGLVAASEGQLAFARTLAEYRAVRAKGQHAVLLAVQGGNALDGGAVADSPGGLLTRVTVVHLTDSALGATSSPLRWPKWLRRGRGTGLTPAGEALVEQLNAQRVFVDLAHIHPDGFWRALEVHAPDRPPIVTHTGVDGVHPHWRNLDDAQIKAIADRGGVVGIMVHKGFIGPPADLNQVVRHLEHVVQVGGEGAVALGTDYDGA